MSKYVLIVHCQCQSFVSRNCNSVNYSVTNKLFEFLKAHWCSFPNQIDANVIAKRVLPPSLSGGCIDHICTCMQNSHRIIIAWGNYENECYFCTYSMITLCNSVTKQVCIAIFYEESLCGLLHLMSQRCFLEGFYFRI